MSRKKDNKLQILELTDIAYATAMFTSIKRYKTSWKISVYKN